MRGLQGTQASNFCVNHEGSIDPYQLAKKVGWSFTLRLATMTHDDKIKL